MNGIETMKSPKINIKNFYSSRYGLHVLIILMSLSLAGIGLVQWLWIQSAVQVREEKYEEQVRTSLETIIEQLERKQQVVFISKQLDRTTIIDGGEKDSTSENLFEYFSQVRDSVLLEEMEKVEADIKIKRISPSKEQESSKPKIKNKIIDSAIDSFLADSNKRITHIKIENNKDFFSNMIVEYETRNNPVAKRINLHSLDDIVQRVLENKNLGDVYEYALWNSKSDSLLVRSDGFEAGYIEKSFRTNLFPEDFVAKDDYLLLYLPDKNRIVLSSLAFMLSGSILFTLIIIVIFFITVKFAFKQKKISRIKSDFINNMTHEFKTPIATISLATDAIKNPKVIADSNKVEHFLRLIKEENQRMNKQVERILQMSLLEKDNLEFHLKIATINDLTAKAILNFELKVKEKKGTIHFTSDSANPGVEVDEVHFLNLLHNLLDNALKYSPEQPEIRVQISSAGEEVHIYVKDRGIGIRKENQEKVFDKFFRETTGDIHDVKGFGLGLSYVKAVVEAFDGRVQVSSMPGKGSTFEIILPKKSIENG